MIYLQLFLSFLKIGAFTYGGGYAMISLIQQEVIEHGWINATEFANMVAVSQMTPGPIAANTAVFVGTTQGGVLGAITATAGLALPPLLYSSLAIVLLQKLKNNRHFAGIIRGVRAAALGLIASAVMFFAENSLIKEPVPSGSRGFAAIFNGNGGWLIEPSWTGIAVFVFILTLLITVKIKPFQAIMLSAAAGTGLYFLCI